MATGQQLWSGPVADPSSTHLAFCGGILDGRVTVRVDQRSTLELSVQADRDWLRLLRPAQVIYLPTALPDYPEWRVASWTRGFVGTEETWRISCAPIHSVLADTGPVTQVAGRRVLRNAGGLNLLLRQYLVSHLLAHLSRRGIDWIERGETQSDQAFDSSWEGDTAKALLRRWHEDDLGLEWRLRPVYDGTRVEKYMLDSVEETGSGAAEPFVVEGRNLVAFEEQAERPGLYNVLQPVGVLPEGAEERAGIEEATWRVAAKNGNVLTLEARQGGPGPVLEDGQLEGAYLLLPDGSLEEVTGTVAPDTVTVADAAEVDEGDDVMFVADAAGLQLRELESPSGIAETAGQRIVGTTEQDFRGERNWLGNPLMSDWPSPLDLSAPLLGKGLATGSAGTPDVAFPAHPNTTIPAGSVVLRLTPSVTSFARVDGDDTSGASEIRGRWSRTSSEVQTDGSGEVGLPIGSGLAVVEHANYYVYPPDMPMPEGWAINDGLEQDRNVVLPYSAEDRGSVVTALADGAQNFTLEAKHPSIAIKGVDPPDREFRYGDQIRREGADGYLIVAQNAAAVAGAVTLAVFPERTLGTSPNLADEAEVTVHRSGADTPATPRPAIWGYGQGGAVGDRQWVGPDSLVWAPGGRSVWARVELTVINQRSQAIDLSDASLPNFEVVDVTGAPSSLGFLAAEDRTIAASSSERITMALQLTPEEDVLLRIGGASVRNAAAGRTAFSAAVLCVWEGATIYIGEAADVPLVEGSHGTPFWQRANRVLHSRRYLPVQYRGSVLEMSEDSGVRVTSPAFTLGGYVIVRIPGWITAQRLRTMEMSWNPFSSEGWAEREVVWGTVRERLSDRVVRQTPQTQFVDVDVGVTVDLTTGEGRTRRTAITSPRPPSAPGTSRMLVRPGDDPQDFPDELDQVIIV